MSNDTLIYKNIFFKKNKEHPPVSLIIFMSESMLLLCILDDFHNWFLILRKQFNKTYGRVINLENNIILEFEILNPLFFKLSKQRSCVFFPFVLSMLYIRRRAMLQKVQFKFSKLQNSRRNYLTWVNLKYLWNYVS